MDSLSPLLSTTFAVFADLKRNLHILRWRCCKFYYPSFVRERNALETVKKAPAASAPARALICNVKTKRLLNRLYTLCFMVTPPLRRFFRIALSSYCFIDISPLYALRFALDIRGSQARSQPAPLAVQLNHGTPFSERIAPDPA